MWVILVGREGAMLNTQTPHKIITTREYLSSPHLFKGSRPKLVNLASSYRYQSRGYYASLLAEARGHRILPSVETLVDLSARSLYEAALPELEDALNKNNAARSGLPASLLIAFGKTQDGLYDRFARLVFDWFRAPALEVELDRRDTGWIAIKSISMLPLHKIAAQDRAWFFAQLDEYTGKDWRKERHKTPAKYTIAVLHDPKEELPPSSQSTLQYWKRLAAKSKVDVRLITKRDLSSIAEYDALFVRETTSIRNHTYRFARRAAFEGMPAIDDTRSMIRCTNKVFLHEQLAAADVPMPPSCIISTLAEVPRAIEEIGLPMVVKIPDGSFSRGVKKAESLEALKTLAADMFKTTELLICQKFLPTSYDWRIGVLGGEPLFATKYFMAKNHWQIIHHVPGQKSLEGGYQSVPLVDVPHGILDMAVRATQKIGDGLYGVDIKDTPEGRYVIEVNDNPNLDHGVEDAAEKDAVWMRLTQWFIDRIDM